MSSYLVEEQTINRILTHIDRNNRSLGFHTPVEGLKVLGYDVADCKGLDRLGQDLVALNFDAVNQRYGTDRVPIVPHVYKGEPASDVQVLKSLQCLIYQCSEGDVPESELYDWLVSYVTALMHAIINRMPEYEKAEWG